MDSQQDLELLEKQEELLAQKEELTAAIEELARKNNFLTDTLNQLQKRNQELDQLLYRTSHDLKSPLTSLQGLLHLLKTEDSQTQFNMIVSFMEQKISVMSGILKSLSMIDEAYFEKIEWKNIELKKVVEQAIDDLRYLPNFDDVKIEIDYGQMEIVRSDELLLYNLLKCLLSNAITFRNSLEPGHVYVSFEESESNLILDVTDDGEGIAPEIGNKIFDMFYRGSDRSIGAGLGLYIAKTVVNRVNGEIRWISKPGKTTFQVILPGMPTD